MLVATDIAARGIDVTALGHVINFDVPCVPDDYIHRVGRTARAELTGSAFTLVAPEEEGDLRAIEQAIDKRLPRVTVPDFDYQARAEHGSKCRTRSGSPRSARAKPKNGAAPMKTPRDARGRDSPVRGPHSPALGAHRPVRGPDSLARGRDSLAGSHRRMGKALVAVSVPARRASSSAYGLLLNIFPGSIFPGSITLKSEGISKSSGAGSARVMFVSL